MSLKVSLPVFLLISLSSESLGGPTTPKVPSILEIIRAEVNNNSSNHLCLTPEEIINSKYLEECEKFPFPQKDAKLESNYDAFLCLAFFDRAFHICHAAARRLEIPVLMNKSHFDNIISEKIEKKIDPLELCMILENIQPIFLEKTRSFVQVLTTELKDPVGCTKICSKGAKKINPLCLVIQVIDQQIQAADAAKKIKDKEAEKEKVKVKAVVKPDAAPPSTNAAPEISQAVAVASDVQGNSQAGKSGQTTSTGKVPPEENPQKPVVPKNSQKEEVTKGKPAPSTEKNKTKESNKPGDDDSATQALPPPVAAPKDKEPMKNNEKVQGSSPGQGQVEKSTLSANTGGEEEIQFGEAEVSDEAGMGLAPAAMDYKEDGEQISPPRSPGTGQDTASGNFKQPENIPKLSVTTDDDSHFFGYFTLFGLFGFGLFAAYHHKHKIFAMLLEGRRSRGGRGRRRPSTANYRKLDCTLEEAVTSQCSSNVTHVIY
ncbi:trans-Golgi network integral membrane protein 2-like [Fopius arisanus]|uniref:Tgoln2_0 protein n=1 Tax=Fopius arisanus TaxID=64838 RepID=A0A0C9RB30_9HYME|nr:PREDICTED: trans-Golgi network integral membrane protein 2-like [Fopius arisanus]